MDPLQPNSKIIFCHHGTKTPNKQRNGDLQNKRKYLKMMQSQIFFFLCHISVTRCPQSSLKLTLVIANAKGQRAMILPIRALFSLFTLPKVTSLRDSFCLGTFALVFARKQCILFFKGRYDHRSSNCNLSNCKLTRKKFRDFNWIRTRSFRVTLALPCSNQLSYENPYIGSRAIC